MWHTTRVARAATHLKPRNNVSRQDIRASKPDSAGKSNRLETKTKIIKTSSTVSAADKMWTIQDTSAHLQKRGISLMCLRIRPPQSGGRA